MFRTFWPERPVSVAEPMMLRPQLAPMVHASFAVAVDTARAFAAAAFTAAASAVTPEVTVPPPTNGPLRTIRPTSVHPRGHTTLPTAPTLPVT
jgi:hypothetical protein